MPPINRLHSTHVRRLTVDKCALSTAFEQMACDFDGDGPDNTYLDIQTGQLIDVYFDDDIAADEMNEDPSMNRVRREAVEADPGRYLEIPERTTEDDHEMIEGFLNSKWTTDQKLWRFAQDAYQGAIGRWRRRVREDHPEVIHKWNEFQEHAQQRRIIEWLAEHGIEAVWA